MLFLTQILLISPFRIKICRVLVFSAYLHLSKIFHFPVLDIRFAAYLFWLTRYKVGGSLFRAKFHHLFCIYHNNPQLSTHFSFSQLWTKTTLPTLRRNENWSPCPNRAKPVQFPVAECTLHLFTQHIACAS
jgi:hypothetical protein